MQKILEELPLLAATDLPLNKAFFGSLNRKAIKQLDPIVHEIHEEVFDEIDCMECGNCCKSLGPRITNRDLEKMGKTLKMKSVDIVAQHLRQEPDEDYVFRTMPCPFLAGDNYCFVYDHRPKACREYPHTDQRNFFQKRELMMKNAETCPAVYEILKRLREKIGVPAAALRKGAK